MSSLFLEKTITLDSIFSEPVYFLNRITPKYQYVDGKRTETIVGYNYTVTNTGDFDRCTVGVLGDQPLLDPDQFLEKQAAGEKIFVEFPDGAVIRPYYNEAQRQVCDSIRAKSIRILEK